MDDRQQRLRAEYTVRMNRVLDYIETHLHSEMSLSTLAAVASFSRYHFHRLFRAVVGETINRYVRRVRLEKAAAMLTNNRATPVTDIALDCGFSNSATFARAFRERFGYSASEWRAQTDVRGRDRLQERKIGQTQSKLWEAYIVTTLYRSDATNHVLWRCRMKEDHRRNVQCDVEVKPLPDMTVAYVRHIGAYRGGREAFGQLLGVLSRWAAPRGLIGRPGGKLLAVYHDDPDITEEDRQRFSLCMTIPEGTPVDGEVGTMVIPAGTYAVGRVEIDGDQYAEAWNVLMGVWLPASGYEPADGVCFEDYLNDPAAHPERKHIVDICIPVRPL